MSLPLFISTLETQVFYRGGVAFTAAVQELCKSEQYIAKAGMVMSKIFLLHNAGDGCESCQVVLP